MENSKKQNGLNPEEVIKSREQFGSNILTPPPKTPIWILFLEKFKDPIIVILLVALTFSFGIGLYHMDFIESVGILIAIALAVGVGFYMEYSSQKKFDELNSQSDFEAVKVIRSGQTIEIPKDQVVVGDVVILAAGDEVPADLEMTSAIGLKLDESTMTGESVPVSKVVKQVEWTGSGYPPYLCLRSTKVSEGSGVGIVVKVGDQTEIGKTSFAAQEESENVSPLNQQLEGLSVFISRTAFGLAGLLMIFLNISYFFLSDNVDYSFMAILQEEIKYLMISITLIVVAVPEGLPLASTLSLAFSMKTMADDNNLVKKLPATETAGAVNIIFSDKTGTFTKNKMEVVGVHEAAEGNAVVMNMAINSTADLSPKGDVIGNPTEGAMISYVNKKVGDESYLTIRDSVTVIDSLPFNSTNKYMTTTVKGVGKKGKTVIYLKGAPEVVSRLISDDSFMDVVELNQQKGRRVISFASGETMETLRYDGSCFIEDPIREDVPAAVKDCYEAGIDVIMMTGDNSITAGEIARQAGMNRKLQGYGQDNWVIEAKDFFTEIKKNRGIPNVIARCKPENKLAIMKHLQALGKICAMNGDGVNDSPSINHADVGFAMGSGTSAAKSAADIVLLDDSFKSIVTGIMWGRSLYKNIQSFLVFQLIINLTACITVLLGPLFGVNETFTVTQMLWINIVMDSLAALALASEPADRRVLKEQPRKIKDFIINPQMAKTIIAFGVIQAAVLLGIIYDIANGGKLGIDLTMIFALFMLVSWWNLFNVRVFGKNKSIFADIKKSGKFLLGSVVILIGTVLIVQFGGKVFSTRPLTVNEWLILFGASSLVVVINEVYYQLVSRKRDAIL